jgi:catechol-2,3-dioxygenase
MNNQESVLNGSAENKFGSKYISHYGIRAQRLQEMIDWYKIFFNAEVQYKADFGVFMTFDEEHHRLVIWTDEDTKDKPENTAGVDHIGIGLAGFGALVENYERLKAAGITPFLPVNHRFTTSLYYKDPDGNEVELSVDNFSSKEVCSEFVRSEQMAKILVPPFGDMFDPDELARLYHAGASEEELARIGMSHS